MNPHNTPTTLWIATLITLFSVFAISACTQTECGPGTHEERGRCVANLPVDCTGPGVEFIDGQCQVKSSVCPANSEFDPETGTCSNPTGSTTPQNNDVGTADTSQDTSEDVTQDTPNDTSNDTTPDTPTFEGCGDNSPQGSVCVSGALINWATNSPLTGEEPLGLILDDLTLRQTSPEKPPFNVSPLLPGGFFLFEDTPIEVTEGPLQQALIIVDEPEEAPSDDWQRTLTGLPINVQDATSYPNQTAFIVPTALVQAWDANLSRSNETSLANTGFLLIRVLAVTEQGLAPVSGATIQNTNPDDDTNIEKYYLDDTLTGFRDTAETGATGSILLVGAPIGQYTASHPNFSFAPTLGGTFPSVAITTVVLGEAN